MGTVRLVVIVVDAIRVGRVHISIGCACVVIILVIHLGYIV